MKIILDSFVQKAQFETILDFAFHSLHDSLIPDHWKPLKELIKQLLEEDMDAQVCIECDSAYYKNGMTIEGVNRTAGDSDVLIVPDHQLLDASQVLDT